MCRWLAYTGRPIHLTDALFKPENSLIRQSQCARWSANATNGDGFGVGWYGDQATPGLFRDVLPAWNDENLRSLAEQIQSGLFFAHVRASTGTATSRTNCHPFRHGRFLFMHNGAIGGFDSLRRELDLAIEPRLYGERRGTTDSETFFYLLLSNGLEADMARAFRRTIGLVEGAMAKAGVNDPFRMTAALTDGEQVMALRYSSDGRSPTLFYGHAALGSGGDGRASDGTATVILSEPLDRESGNWVEVPEARILVAGGGAIMTAPFEPAR
ncbi:MAG: class II glutamine amidotransferase [Alphaproteobacteria bacterium]